MTYEEETIETYRAIISELKEVKTMDDFYEVLREYEYEPMVDYSESTVAEAVEEETTWLKDEIKELQEKIDQTREAEEINREYRGDMNAYYSDLYGVPRR